MKHSFFFSFGLTETRLYSFHFILFCRGDSTGDGLFRDTFEENDKLKKTKLFDEMRAGAGERKLEFEVKFRLLSDGDYMNKLTLKRCTTLFSPDSII